MNQKQSDGSSGSDSYSSMPDLVSCNNLASFYQDQDQDQDQEHDIPFAHPSSHTYFKEYLLNILIKESKFIGGCAAILIFAMIYYRKR